MEIKEQIIFQVELNKELYLAERSRREAVRSSLGLPLAALSFTAFGFAAFSGKVVWIDSSPFEALLSTSTLMLAIFALSFFISAINQLYHLDYSADPITPEAADFLGNAEEITVWLEEEDGGKQELDAIKQEAVVLALEDLAKGYNEAFRELSIANSLDLKLQKTVFDRLLIGLGMLISAIFLTAIESMLLP